MPRRSGLTGILAGALAGTVLCAGARAGAAPGIEYQYAYQFALVWNDGGSGADDDGAFYRPLLPPGFHALGHYAQGNYAPPTGKLVVVRELEAGALAPPDDYVEIWNDSGSGADLDGSAWMPLPPPGYVCLGSVAQSGYTKPDVDAIRCVRADLARPAQLLPNRIWDDSGSGANSDFSAWRVVPEGAAGLDVGTFVGRACHCPPAGPHHVLAVTRVSAAPIFDFPDAPYLDLKLATDFTLRWHDGGSGSDRDGSFWDPQAPAPSYHALGSLAQPGYANPGRTTDPQSFPIMLMALELVSGSLAPPVDYQIIWADSGSGASLDGSMWKPLPPPGYVCLGTLAQAGYAKPSTDAMRCVAQDLVVPARIESSPWDDAGSDADSDFQAWKIGPAETTTPDFGIDLGTFAGVNAHLMPSELVYTLNRRSAAQQQITTEDLEDLADDYAPRLRLHPDEKFLPDGVLEVLDSITDLCSGLVHNESNYDGFLLSLEQCAATDGQNLAADVVQLLEQAPPVIAADPDFRYWQQYDLAPLDSDGTPFLAGDLSRARAYVRAKPWNQVLIEVQYWIFYPFNGPGKFRLQLGSVLDTSVELTEVGRHYGDWEVVALRFFEDAGSFNDRTLHSVYLSRHDSEAVLAALDPALTVSGNHPTIYVARDSHAHYPTAGQHAYKRLSHIDLGVGHLDVDAYDLTADGGAVLDLAQSGNLVLVSSALDGAPVDPPVWLAYEKRWGQYLPNQFVVSIDYTVGTYDYEVEEVGAGPSGPNLKPIWPYVVQPVPEPGMLSSSIGAVAALASLGALRRRAKEAR